MTETSGLEFAKIIVKQEHAREEVVVDEEMAHSKHLY